EPSKDPSAPPPGWDPAVKAGAAYPPPPPYQDNPMPPGGYPMPAQPYPQYPQGTTVTVQPTIYVTQTPLAHPLPDYLGYSIFTMLCCCLPLGIAALVYSILTREANHQGNQEAAQRNSRLARILNHTALGIGIAIIILYIIYFTVIVA
uniref:Si:rp71-77l1.1 n=2 Tax=Lepisosteus oculatus TaxID=7918 RepID=W5M770_LEPOC